MKIKDLDRNEVYGLEEIKKDAVKFDMLKEWLGQQDGRDWNGLMCNFITYDAVLYYNDGPELWMLATNSKSTKCALTLFDLDITDYQVDCSDLSKEQIEEMGSVLLSKGKDYLSSKKFALSRNHNSDFLISSDESFYITNKQDDKTTITYDKFMELFGEKIDNLEVNQGYKESENKCNYELDFDFIKDIAMRIQNEPKYEPYNWKKPMDIEQLSNAMLRHVIEVKKGNFDDNGELGHLLAVAANAMFIYYQKKHHND